MAAKLVQISTQYHTFVDDQVLTKDQLNEFISYFEDQDRLSRIFLSGVGLVCGFRLRFDPAKPSVTISQGAGVTTDGDLINLYGNLTGTGLKSIDLEKIEYAWVKKFEDHLANYHFFKRLVTIDGNVQEEPLDLWEILPGESETTKPLNTLPDLKNKVVLLYLESYAKEGDLCTAIDCDSQGVEQVARLRVLLVSKADAAYIASIDSIYSKHNQDDVAVNLPPVAVPRVVLSQLNTSNYNELKRAYHTALVQNTNLIAGLTEGISKMANAFEPVLKLNISSSALDNYLAKLKSIVNFGPYSVPFNIQYRYDCIKDITDTYNEIKSLLLSLKEECCPDIHAFPKHLMLGCLDETEDDLKNYRHQFYASPILNGGTSRVEQCRTLALRLFRLISDFKTTTGETRITPSNKLPDLGFRAIPFYYELKDDFLTRWNFFKTKKQAEKTNLSYHRSALAPIPHVQEPLLYNTDRFDFYRIEGHQGKDYRKALEEIDSLKRKYGLSFDVKALSLNMNQETLNVDDYECEFEDLNVLLKAWTTEQECILGQVASFFSGFSVALPGANVKESLAAGRLASSRLSDASVGFVSGLSSGTTTGTKESAQLLDISAYKLISSAKSNVIVDNLTLDNDALGKVMKAALEETKGGSVNDIIARANFLVADAVNTDAWKEQPEIKKFVIDGSIELMAYTHVLSQKMPGLIRDVNIAAVNTYKLTMEELCVRVKRLKTSYQNLELSSTLKALMQVLIIQLSSICCSAKKLEILLDEINKRKEAIIIRLQLSKFIDKHPGAEHKAGVEPGGTFILVYLNKVQPTPGTAPAGLAAASRELLTSAASLSVSRISTNLTHLVSTETSVGNLPVAERVELAGIRGQVIPAADVPDNTVVADFSLPYMCCSDCAPVNFIVPRQPVSLRLEQDHFCLGKDVSPLLFEVSPDDGVIKANPETEGMTIEGNKLSFDPETFPDEMLGKTIRFTVNDQITQTEITVYRAVQFDFEVPESPVSETTITFVPTGNLDGASFLWSFGDDNLSTERNPTHTYRLPVNNENKVIVSLTVTAPNGVCHATVEHEIVFKMEDTKISLKDSDFCENDKTNYPFEITPAGAQAKIEGKGVQQNTSGTFVFIPAIAGPGPVEFVLNGAPSGLLVTVHQAPVAAFSHEQLGNQLILTNNSTGANSYIWNINGDKLERSDSSPVVIGLTPNSPTGWRVGLAAISQFCGSADSGTVSFETRFEEEPANQCIDETKGALLVDQKRLSGLDFDSDFVHPIWLKTMELYGGSGTFGNGVLNDIDNFLSGKNNPMLPDLFIGLLSETAEIIARLHPEENKEEYPRMLELFRLQLQLFYHILGCQDPSVVKETAEFIQQVFDVILDMLKMLKERQVEFSESLRDFLKMYIVRVKDLEIVLKHVEIILNENLV
ncbi:PKD domain-containing protein [Gaoshiqia sp. Z1-71]|uniref:PKD domain-containing protein n=1 Tax=Gaoshiqia hydrogeniformans TaxID=3290090 RepID=UPI003BF8C4D9